MKISLAAIFLFFCHFSSFAAVILQYHHVSNTTPKSTSITPAQFEVHLKYLHDNHFNVVPLSQIIEKIKNQQPLKDKTVAITFDDAYLNVLTNAKPLLDRFNYPYTIFVNPAIITRHSNYDEKSTHYISWQQLKALGDSGVIIANHGYEHNSMTRITDGLTPSQWLKKQGNLLLQGEDVIKNKTGQSWRYLAYPYGEYDPAIQAWAKEHNFIAFSQQSGAVGLSTDLTSVPRFPASMPYDQLSDLADKINSLPFNIHLQGKQAETVFVNKETSSVTFDIKIYDFLKSGLGCYISGLGKQEIQWHGDTSFTLNFSGDLPIGRVRSNCTAASISKPGRFYWYSKPWFILNDDGSWYPL